jgi:hypothetical protein
MRGCKPWQAAADLSRVHNLFKTYRNHVRKFKIVVSSPVYFTGP